MLLKTLRAATATPKANTKHQKQMALASKKASPRTKQYTITDLHNAASNGDLETLKLILSTSSIDVNAKDSHTSATALHKAAARNHTEAMKLLVTHGANTEAKDGVDATPLHYSASHGHTEAVATLVLQKVNVNAKDVYGYTAFHAALKKHHFELADTLRMYGADINTKTETGATALHLACDAGDLEIVRFLLDKGARQVRDFHGNPPLFKAILAANTDLCQILIDALPSVNDLANADRQTVLHVVSCVSGRDALVLLQYLVNKCTEREIQSLINVQDARGKTALHYAVQSGITYGMSKELVRLGAETAIADKSGRTPLHICAECRRTIVAKFLMRNGAKCPKSVGKQLGL